MPVLHRAAGANSDYASSTKRVWLLAELVKPVGVRDYPLFVFVDVSPVGVIQAIRQMCRGLKSRVVSQNLNNSARPRLAHDVWNHMGINFKSSEKLIDEIETAHIGKEKDFCPGVSPGSRQSQQGVPHAAQARVKIAVRLYELIDFLYEPVLVGFMHDRCVVMTSIRNRLVANRLPASH